MDGMEGRERERKRNRRERGIEREMDGGEGKRIGR